MGGRKKNSTARGGGVLNRRTLREQDVTAHVEGKTKHKLGDLAKPKSDFLTENSESQIQFSYQKSGSYGVLALSEGTKWMDEIIVSSR